MMFFTLLYIKKRFKNYQILYILVFLQVFTPHLQEFITVIRKKMYNFALRKKFIQTSNVYFSERRIR